MSFSSQPEPSNRPSSSSPPPARRLRSPSERFGAPHQPEAVERGEEAPEAVERGEQEAPESEATRSSSARSRKSRHERHRFEREDHRFAPRGAARRSVETRPRASRTGGEENGAPLTSPATARSAASIVPSPTLLRIQNARKRFWRRFTCFFVGLSLAGAGAAALYAPGFNIDAVTITGLHATAPVLVRPIAARLLGHNVFRAPKAQIAQSVERLPTVAKARVVLRAGLPPRVVLQVREREPIVRVGDGANWWVADAGGVPYRRVGARDGALPVLRWNGEIQTMKRFDAASWNDAVRLVQAVEGADKGTAALAGVRQMNLDSSGDATLFLRKPDGAPDLIVRLGNDGWSEKLARARIALLYFERTGRDAAELNLVSSRLPRWKPRPVAVQEPQGASPTRIG